MMQMKTKLWKEHEVQEMIAESRKWVGRPWRHQGRSWQGVDCVGLFKAVAKSKGFIIDMPDNYTRFPDPNELREGMKEVCEEIRIKLARPGDFYIMQFEGRGIHVAMKTDQGILHAAAIHRKVVEHTLSLEWERKIIAAFRLRRRVL